MSWQVVPVRLIEMQKELDAARAGRVMGVMLNMRKLDVAQLEAAAAG